MELPSQAERLKSLQERKDRLMKLVKADPNPTMELVRDIESTDRLIETFKDPITCTMCGKVDYPYQTSSPNREEQIEHQLCFTCNFWRCYEEMKEDGRTVRINGFHYRIGAEPQAGRPSSWCGFGGREFKIRFHDGREVISHNLWCQGQIPGHFLASMPDNAVFFK